MNAPVPIWLFLFVIILLTGAFWPLVVAAFWAVVFPILFLIRWWPITLGLLFGIPITYSILTETHAKPVAVAIMSSDALGEYQPTKFVAKYPENKGAEALVEAVNKYLDNGGKLNALDADILTGLNSAIQGTYDDGTPDIPTK